MEGQCLLRKKELCALVVFTTVETGLLRCTPLDIALVPAPLHTL